MQALYSDLIRTSRPKLTLFVLGGILGAASIGTANAATADDNVPSVAVRYNQQSLDSESGARVLYRRIVNAATEVCPNDTASHFVAPAVRQCREESIARAVFQINSPKLVAVYTTASKRG
jgi:UrcA family protein